MKTIEREQVSCLLCGSYSHEEVYSYEVRVQMEKHSWLWTATQVVCCDCGMVFTNPMPTSSVLERFYSSYLMYGEVTHDRQLRDSQIRFVEKKG